MGHHYDTPADLAIEARDRIAAMRLAFFDRRSLNLGEREIDGIISGFNDLEDMLDEIRALTGRGGAPAERGDAAPEPSKRVTLYPDYDTKLRAEKDIAMIKHLSGAANELLLKGATDKGADSETTEAVWAFVDEINEAARRVEDVLEVKGYPNWGLPPEHDAPPAPQRAPAARPPSGRVDLTEEAPPEPVAKPDDTAGRARA